MNANVLTEAHAYQTPMNAFALMALKENYAKLKYNRIVLMEIVHALAIRVHQMLHVIQNLEQSLNILVNASKAFKETIVRTLTNANYHQTCAAMEYVSINLEPMNAIVVLGLLGNIVTLMLMNVCLAHVKMVLHALMESTNLIVNVHPAMKESNVKMISMNVLQIHVVKDLAVSIKWPIVSYLLKLIRFAIKKLLFQ